MDHFQIAEECSKNAYADRVEEVFNKILEQWDLNPYDGTIYNKEKDYRIDQFRARYLIISNRNIVDSESFVNHLESLMNPENQKKHLELIENTLKGVCENSKFLKMAEETDDDPN